MKNTNYNMIDVEKTMISEIKELGTEIRIDEFRPNGDLSSSKIYKNLRCAVKRMAIHAQGYFPVYQNSSVMKMGYKMTISIT